jgi:hypothetical protein
MKTDNGSGLVLARDGRIRRAKCAGYCVGEFPAHLSRRIKIWIINAHSVPFDAAPAHPQAECCNLRLEPAETAQHPTPCQPLLRVSVSKCKSPLRSSPHLEDHFGIRRQVDPHELFLQSQVLGAAPNARNFSAR